jgi:hypothetical protein
MVYGSRAARLHQLFEDVGGLPVGELAPEVVVLGHTDLGVPELITDLAGGHGGIVEEARDGLAQGVTDQSLDPGVVAASSRTRRHTRRTFDGSRQPPRESGNTGCTVGAMARRRRLSIVMAQLGSGISHSPLSPDVVEGNRSSRHPSGVPAASRVHRSPVQADFIQPIARHSPMRQPVASIISDRSGRSHACAGSLAFSVSSHYCWRSSTVSDRGLRRGIPSIRRLRAPGRQAHQAKITILTVWAPLTVFGLIAARTRSTTGGPPPALARTLTLA